jgi:MFS family permease
VRKPSKALWEYTELGGLFFLQMMAFGMGLVPLSRILNGNGYPGLAAYAFATTAVAAFISPLIFGAMADRHASPARVLRWLSLASAAAAGLAGSAIDHHFSPLAVLMLIQVYSLVSVPTSSIASAIVFSRLKNSSRQFGAIRAAGTFGWMCGCWGISLLDLDASARAIYGSGTVWVALALFTIPLPGGTPLPSGRVGLRERMGWDALVLLKNRDHRVVFLTAALFSIPIAAFYPFTPPQLQALGFHRTAAWMTLGQVTEIMAMLSLASLIMRWRLKWIFAIGLFFGAVRFFFCSFNRPDWLLAGITLHGLSFTLFYTTAQIYLDERIEPAWRARAQGLMSLMNSGIGNLIGYLATGWWFRVCSQPGGVYWRQFWLVLTLAVALVMIFFLLAYHGQSPGFRRHLKTDAD